jgi:hypothetical protein
MTVLTLGFVNGHAQKKSKCKTTFDKELGIEVYKDVDSTSRPIDEDAFNDYFLSISGQFTNITKKYPDDQMVRFGYMVGVDGKMTLIKLLSPTGNKEIEDQVKKILNSAPLQKPCECDNEPVPCNGGISVRLYPKKK